MPGSSLLSFTRRFNEAISAYDTVTSCQVKLLLLLDLWPDLFKRSGQAQFVGFFDQYTPRMTEAITDSAIYDLALPELVSLLEVTRQLEISTQEQTVRSTLIRQLCYVGDIDTALPICCEVTGEQVDTAELTIGLKASSSLILLGRVIEQIEPAAPKTAALLREVQTDWQALTCELHHDRAWCLLVQSGEHLSGHRGCLTRLTGSVHPAPKRPSADKETTSGEAASDKVTSDQVSFNHQLRSYDDPMVGGVHSALGAVRSLLLEQGVAHKAKDRDWVASFEIDRDDHLLTGDSLGLAAGLITFTQLLRTDLLRHERNISGAVAFTGGLSDDGTILPVNDATLSLKVERAFFSHVEYLVVPEGNHAAAAEHVRSLQERYPRRRLELAAVESLERVVNNHNAVSFERVKPCVYVQRFFGIYSGTPRMQLPILMLLLYTFVCILFPKARFWFDWQPAQAQLTQTGFEVLNADAYHLWGKEIDAEGINAVSSAVDDIDGDGDFEVAVGFSASSASEWTSNVFIYSSNGDSRLHVLSPASPGAYLPRDDLDSYFFTTDARIVSTGDRTVIVGSGYKCNPAQAQIKVWNGTENVLSYYINQGAVGASKLQGDMNLDGLDELVFGGTNNRLKASVVFGLSAVGTFGVSPPYKDLNYDIEWIKPGNQEYYIVFPSTDASEATTTRGYNAFETCTRESPSELRVEINENTDGSLNHYRVFYYLHTAAGMPRVKRVDISDPFETWRNHLADSGKVEQIAWIEYKRRVRDAVMYWTDSGFVTEGQLRAAGQ